MITPLTTSAKCRTRRGFFSLKYLWAERRICSAVFRPRFYRKKIGSGCREWADLPKGKAKGNNSLTLGVKSPQDILYDDGRGKRRQSFMRSLPGSLRAMRICTRIR